MYKTHKCVSIFRETFLTGGMCHATAVPNLQVKNQNQRVSWKTYETQLHFLTTMLWNRLPRKSQENPGSDSDSSCETRTFKKFQCFKEVFFSFFFSKIYCIYRKDMRIPYWEACPVKPSSPVQQLLDMNYLTSHTAAKNCGIIVTEKKKNHLILNWKEEKATKEIIITRFSDRS